MSGRSIARTKRRRLALTLALAAANLVALNVLALDHFRRFDFTRDRVYTLHPATVALLEGLDDIVTMRLYLSEKAFSEQPRYAFVPRQVRDVIDEFVGRASGRIRLEVRDPSADPQYAKEARAAGVAEVPFTGRGEQSTIQFRAFAGLVLSYGGRPDAVVPYLFPLETLEYQIAAALDRLVRREVVTVAFGQMRPRPEGAPNMPGGDENDIETSWRFVKKELEKRFDVLRWTLDREVPPHVDLLVLYNLGLDDRAVFYVDQFLMRGGKLLVMGEGTEENRKLRTLVARAGMPDAFFAHLGFAIRRNVVLDRQCLAPLGQPPNYWVPRVLPRYFDPESPLLQGVDSFYLVAPSSVELNPPEGVEAVVLAKSSPAAWAQEGLFDLRPGLEPPTDLSAYRQFDLVGMLRGRFSSWFADRPLPEGVFLSSRGPTRAELEAQGLEVSEDPQEPEPAGLAAAPFVRDRSPETTIVVVGNTRFLQNDLATKLPGNLDFFVTLVERLTGRGDLAAIRNRSAAPAAVRADLPLGMRRALQYGGWLAAPTLVLLFGVGGTLLGRRRRGEAA